MCAHFIEKFITPESIAIYGANNQGMGIGSIQLMNLIRYGFKGNLYPIHLKLERIMGLKAYETIADVPEIPDLVIIALPAKIVPQIFQECGEKGVESIVLVSGGFRETENQKTSGLRAQIKEVAENYGMRFIGPNCLGVYNGWIYPEDKNNVFNMNIWAEIPRGKFSIISQSGTLSSHIWFDPKNLDLGLGKSFSVGNEADINVIDVLKYLKDDPQTDVIGLYIEEIKEGRRFMELAKEITPHKPIIGIYVGGTEASNRALKSHTGSIAGNSRIYEGVFRETGIIKTELVEEFLDLDRFAVNGIFPQGNRVGVLTNSGGPGVMIAHNAEQNGLVVPEFSGELQEKLREMVIPTASTRNPLDTTFDLEPFNYYVKIPKILMKSGEIDILIIYGVFGLQDVLREYLKDEGIRSTAEFKKMVEKNKPPLEEILIPPIQKLSQKTSIPVIYINPENYNSKWSKKIRQKGALLFKLWDRPTRCLKKLVDYKKYKKNSFTKK
ncbi:MAG: CoA-binding protein [Promethearchaeia archaeon]